MARKKVEITIDANEIEKEKILNGTKNKQEAVAEKVRELVSCLNDLTVPEFVHGIGNGILYGACKNYLDANAEKTPNKKKK
ncbi:MAG: hypothetical protein MJZ26_11470 [Fibrobacter sp.]|nr:hypothetical protein [Fibrobacter sp.]